MGEASVLSLTAATGRQVERDNMLIGDGGREISEILPPVFLAVCLCFFVLSEDLKITGSADFPTVIASHS